MRFGAIRAGLGGAGPGAFIGAVAGVAVFINLSPRFTLWSAVANLTSCLIELEPKFTFQVQVGAGIWGAIAW